MCVCAVDVRCSRNALRRVPCGSGAMPPCPLGPPPPSRHRLRDFHADPTHAPAGRLHATQSAHRSCARASPSPWVTAAVTANANAKQSVKPTTSASCYHLSDPTPPIPHPAQRDPFVPTQAKKAASPCRDCCRARRTLGLAGLRASRRSAKPSAPLVRKIRGTRPFRRYVRLSSNGAPARRSDICHQHNTHREPHTLTNARVRRAR